MDYLEMAREALELRQFLEAENYLIKYSSAADEKSDEYYEIKFNLSLSLESVSFYEDFKNYLSQLLVQKHYQKIIELTAKILAEDRFLNKSYIYHFHVEALYHQGRHAESASMAREHIEFLVNKRLYHHWKNEIIRYQEYFKNYIFFNVMALQLYIAIEDVHEADNKWHKILEQIEKKFTKLEDTKDVEKNEIVSRCHELVSQLEGNDIRVSMLSHKSILTVKKHQGATLGSTDWKKLVELIVYEPTWFNLKLALDLTLEANEEIFLEALKLMKKKKGFDLIKLTRFDRRLKDKLIGKRVPVAEITNPGIGEEDLKLSEPVQANELEGIFREGPDEEIARAERDMIKTLAFQELNAETIIDLVTTFIQLDFFLVAKFLLRQAKELKLTDSNIRKIEYLKIIVSTKTEEFYLALAEVSELIGRTDVLLEEYTELRYMEAALFEQVGDIENAIRSYQEVRKVDPNYRRLKERMQKFA